MNEIERALAKTEKREARKRLAAEVGFSTDEVITDVMLHDGDVSPHVVQAPKEKPRKNAVFTISVDMPHTQFTFSLVKTNILSHAPAGRLTESEVRKHIVQGLKPLLGGIE